MNNCKGCKYDCNTGVGCSHPQANDNEFWNDDATTCYTAVANEQQKKPRVLELFYEVIDYYQNIGGVSI